MELLSPAGNINHIDVAINKKADAVYGGLKNWNARNKAMNFSIAEYNESVRKLHENRIKFYMTLNILVFDSEIEEIIKFLKEDNTELPDAFIIADIGLIRRIHKEFPNIPLHFSTQFGIHNINDCNFAESLGAERAILARELTFSEVENIRNNTKLEIENFIWGSQCISFSGLCFFGSLINCGNGNRGKCIITCRDIYQVGSEEGNFLYVPDLNCTKMIEKLNKINIDCIKLEGRRRKKEELENIIGDIKNNNFSDEQNGYLYGEKNKDNNLFEKINKRIKAIYNIKELDKINKYDVFIEYKNNIPIQLISNIEKYEENNKNIFYVYSELKRDFMYEKNNISLDLSISDDIVEEILYVNSKGEGKTFFKEKNNYIQFNVDKLREDIDKIDKNINLYKIKYKRNKKDVYKIDVDLYKKVVDYITEDNKIKKEKIKYNSDNKIQKLTVETDKIEYAKELLNDKEIEVIYDISTVENLRKIGEILQELGKNVIYKLPIFNFKSENLTQYYKKLTEAKVMFTRASQIFETRDIKFNKKMVDYTIYVWNSETLQFLDENNIDVVTASPELSFEKNNEILGNHNIQYIIAGKLPLVYTRQCFSNLYKCSDCEKCRNNVKVMKNIDKNIKFKILCKDDHRIIYSDEPILNNFTCFENMDNFEFRYITTDQSMEEIKETIKLLKEKDYFTNMKNMNLWKNSYQGNILENRG